jgi:hypothetical protein
VPKFVIERTLPGAGQLSDTEIQAIAARSNGVLKGMNEAGTSIQWVESYVTEDKIYCVYTGPSEDAVREHAKQGGFPADSVARVSRTIDPTSAEPA